MTKPSAVRLVSNQYFWPFVLVTSLFFFWGFARAILDVLNKHFQLSMGVSKGESALLQVTVYGAYFLMALPAGLLIRRWGTRRGVITGLLLFAVGSFLFIPAGENGTFYSLLQPLFVIGCGLVLLEVAANPYVTELGDAATAAGRLNRAQSFNGLGSIVGALVGGLFFFSDATTGAARDVAVPYTVLGSFILVAAFVFSRLRLPDISSAENEFHVPADGRRLGAVFGFGLFALFSYEVAEISINTFFINYVSDTGYLSPLQASFLLSFGGLGLFMAGRFVGSALMRRIAAERLLAGCAFGALLCMGLVVVGAGSLSIVALIVCYVFESIMFPTIFALALSRVGAQKAKASSILMMSVIGGAVGPLLTGGLADRIGISMAFVIPLVGFAVVLVYALFCLEHHS